MGRILIIEDDARLRMVLRQILSLLGHTVMEARTGVEGIAALRRDPPELVLTDVVMPDQDGIGVLMMMRAELPQVPVIAMSGGASNSSLYLDITKKLGAREMLSKPFSADQLKAAVREFLPDSNPPASRQID